MSDTRPQTQRQLRRMEQLVRDRRLPSGADAQALVRRPNGMARRARRRPASSGIKIVQSYLQLYG